MDERNWFLLSLIGERKSLTQVSEELFISQPALSYRIKKMEEYFGTELLIRTNKGLQVTPQGELVIQYANEYIQSLKRLKEDIYTIEHSVKGPLNIGASSAVAQYLLPSVLSKFHSIHQNVDLNLLTGFSPTLIEHLMQNKIHIAFLREDIEWSGYKKLLASDGIYLVSKEPVHITDLPQLNRVEYKTNLSLKMILDGWWAQNFKTSPRISMMVDNAEACKEMVRKGLGYAILTGLTLNNQEDLSCVPLENMNGERLMRHTWIYATDEAASYLTVKKILEFIDVEIPTYQGF